MTEAIYRSNVVLDSLLSILAQGCVVGTEFSSAPKAQGDVGLNTSLTYKIECMWRMQSVCFEGVDLIIQHQFFTCYLSHIGLRPVSCSIRPSIKGVSIAAS